MPRPLDPGRRSDILRAARAVFLERGYSGARMSEIAIRTGLATGTLYRSFPSKEALARALTEDFYVRLTAAILPSLVHADGAFAIAEVVRTAIAFAADERDLIRILRLDLCLTEQRPAQFSPARVQLHELLARTLQDGMSHGVLHRYDALVLAELIAGLVEWIVEVSLIRGNGAIERYEATLVSMLQHALLHVPEQS